MPYKDYDIIFGETIRRERKARNIEVDELAAIMDLSPQFIGLIERGQRGTKLSNLIKFADLFDMSLDELVYGNLRQKGEPTKHDTLKILTSRLSDNKLDFLIAVVRDMDLLGGNKDD